VLFFFLVYLLVHVRLIARVFFKWRSTWRLYPCCYYPFLIFLSACYTSFTPIFRVSLVNQRKI